MPDVTNDDLMDMIIADESPSNISWYRPNWNFNIRGRR